MRIIKDKTLSIIYIFFFFVSHTYQCFNVCVGIIEEQYKYENILHTSHVHLKGITKERMVLASHFCVRVTGILMNQFYLEIIR